MKAPHLLLYSALVCAGICRLAAAPSNDNFANSAPLTGSEHFVLTHNIGATAESGEPVHHDYEEFSDWSSPGPSLWWTWTAPASGPVSLDTGGSGPAPILAIYTGNALNNLTLIASNLFDNGVNEPGRSRLGFYVTAGQVYRIVVDGRFYQFDPQQGQGMIALSLLAGAKTKNDFFANAYTIPPGTLSVRGTHLNTTREPGEPDHNFQSEGRSIWWRWTAQSNGPVTLDTAGSSFTPTIAVYTGASLAGLNLVAEDDHFEGSLVNFQGIAGTTYHIAVDDERDSGEVVLNFRQRPPNDRFANRIVVSGSSFTTQGENRAATEEPGEPNHANAYGTKSVWWSWTAPSSGRFTLDAIGSSFNPAMHVYTGSTVSALTPIGNDDGDSKSATRLSFSATQGTTYHFAVDSDFNHDRGGDIVLNLAPSETRPPNDNFANRITINQFPAVIRGSNVGTTRESFNEIPYDLYDTLWWRYIAPGNGIVTLRKVTGVPSLRFVTLQGTAVDNLTTIADNEEPFANPPRIDCSSTYPVRGGNEYLISVGNDDQWTLDQGDFSIDISFTPAAYNDPFVHALPIPAGTLTVTGTTVAASLEAGEPLIGTNANSVWWSYTAPVSGPVVLTTVGSAIDTALGVYTGSSVGALTRIATNDAAYTWPVITGPSNDRPSRVTFNAVAGQQYRIAVSTARGAHGEVVLNLPKLAISDLLSVSSTLQPNRALDFTANLRLRNLNTSPSGPLRIRMFARAGFSHLDGLLGSCGKNLPAMNVADQELAIIDLAAPGYLSAQSSVDRIVSGTLAPPYERGEWGQGWGAMAVLEELTEDGWDPRDSRLLIFGNWPLVGGFIGPGGGVITVASGTGQILASPGFIDVSVGPPAAVRLGARWRVTPGNCGSVCEFTNFTAQTLSLLTRKVDFTIDVTSLPGFNAPTNQTIRLRSGLHTPLNLVYEVNPPRLFYDATGLSITGTPGTAYRIESAGHLRAPLPWASNISRTVTAGLNLIPNTTPTPGTNRFYRAFWLSN